MKKSLLALTLFGMIFGLNLSAFAEGNVLVHIEAVTAENNDRDQSFAYLVQLQESYPETGDEEYEPDWDLDNDEREANDPDFDVSDEDDQNFDSDPSDTETGHKEIGGIRNSLWKK